MTGVEAIYPEATPLVTPISKPQQNTLPLYLSAHVL
jgi:hypothetical protein